MTQDYSRPALARRGPLVVPPRQRPCRACQRSVIQGPIGVQPTGGTEPERRIPRDGKASRAGAERGSCSLEATLWTSAWGRSRQTGAGTVVLTLEEVDREITRWVGDSAFGARAIPCATGRSGVVREAAWRSHRCSTQAPPSL